jgi:hypothetical protein
MRHEPKIIVPRKFTRHQIDKVLDDFSKTVHVEKIILLKASIVLFTRILLVIFILFMSFVVCFFVFKK